MRIKGVDDGGDHAGGGGDGETDEVFAIRAAGIFGNRVKGNIEAGQTGCAAEEEEKSDEVGPALELDSHVEIREDGPIDELDAPGEGEDAGGDAEADDVGEGVELAAEIGDGVGHAGDAAVESVDEDGDANIDSGEFEMARGTGDVEGEIHGAEEGFHDGEEAQQEVAGGEESGEGVGGAAGTPVRGVGIDEAFGDVETRHGTTFCGR